MIKGTQNTETLDSQIHRTIRVYCNPTNGAIQPRQTLNAFMALAKHASAHEIRIHKSEYVYLFTKLILAIPKELKEKKIELTQCIPQITKLTDWFFSKALKSDPAYKNRLRGLVKTIQNYQLPVDSAKQQDWKLRLAVKKRSNPRPFLPDPDRIYHFALADCKIRNKRYKTCE